MFQRSADDVGQNLKIAVRVHAESAAGRDLVVVENAQAAELAVLRVVVIAKGKRMVTVEPIELGSAAVGGGSDCNHDEPPISGRLDAGPERRIRRWLVGGSGGQSSFPKQNENPLAAADRPRIVAAALRPIFTSESPAMSSGPSFPPTFPQGCPPADAAPAGGMVFRIASNDPPLEDDFLSAAELGRQPPAKLTRSQTCRRHALSVYRSIDDARHHVKVFPGTGRFIAAGTLAPEYGVTKDTPNPTHPSHVD